MKKKKCPFCRGSNLGELVWTTGTLVVCQVCGARGPSSKNIKEREHVKLWNKTRIFR